MKTKHQTFLFLKEDLWHIIGCYPDDNGDSTYDMNYRFYSQSGWLSSSPAWLSEEWEGNIKVKYWNSNWQGIIISNDISCLKKILYTGFDGACLDIIDVFEYFEEQ